MKTVTTTPLEAAFRRLQHALERRKLWTGRYFSGDDPRPLNRTAFPIEFELMSDPSLGTLRFKHKRTRNYVEVRSDGSLWVPITQEPFCLGFFGDSSFSVKYTPSGALQPDRIIAEIPELTEDALFDALDKLPAHRCSEIHCFELDAENPGCADAITSRGNVYSITP